jgi:hypothetical protein
MPVRNSRRCQPGKLLHLDCTDRLQQPSNDAMLRQLRLTCAAATLPPGSHGFCGRAQPPILLRQKL